ncbi:hypothetical protein NUW58_g617 [Xylaria curta]|uniref:Uncharacterized protein n=1 Tax=Xylaria curta TaxID=42375 RepID=A0ACC1PQ83_9PEZI|nr:hypothetical protein NUW58_g617 [Xylaria curta]
MRHELEDGHQFDFVEGVARAPMSQDVAALASPDQSFYAFYDPSDYRGLRLAVDQLTQFVKNEGPFDGVVGFSGGAVLAAMCILDRQRQTGGVDALPFRYAIFVSSAKTHIWGRCDDVEPTGGADLSGVCEAAVRSIFVHDGGHEFPRDIHLTRAVQAVRRTLAFEAVAGS